MPDRPTQPTIISSTSSTITLTIGPCEENGGATLEFYTIYRDDGSLSDEFAPIHNGLFENDFTFVATDLTPGLLYQFRTTVTNRIGESAQSSIASFYAADIPDKPASLTKGNLSDRTQIELNWPVHLDGDVPVIGYVLEADLENFGHFEVIMDGLNHPDVRSHLLTEVT